MGRGGIEEPQECLTTDWALKQFGDRRGRAQAEYREFVKEGIGEERIYSKVKGQRILLISLLAM